MKLFCKPIRELLEIFLLLFLLGLIFSCPTSGGSNVDQSTPQTPTGLTATGASSTSLLVSWSSVSGAASYQVFQDLSASGAFTTKVYDSTATSFTCLSLATGTTYYFKVQATNSAGSSALSSAASGTPTATVSAPAIWDSFSWDGASWQ